MSKQPFNHSEQSRKQLTERGNELWRNMNAIKYTGVRKEQVQHELSCIAFEQLYRDGKMDALIAKQHNREAKRRAKNAQPTNDDEVQDD